jgi:phosphoribosylamine--glycine ligase
MKILIIGNGAREHCLAWKIAQNPEVREIYTAPGNAGTASIATNLDISATDLVALRSAVEEIGIDYTIVGPEAPLAAGIVNYFEQRKLPIFGPTEAASRIESSKVFSKNILQKYSIPCPFSESFSDYGQAMDYINSKHFPIVIKADGLAAGKGVIIAYSKEEADSALTEMMVNKVFGQAGDNVILEQFLEGKEVSLLAFTDGNTVVPMIPACDYKRIFDDDQGPNTGGMGSYSPPSFFDSALTDQVLKTIIEPVVEALAKEGCPYKGVLYAGLMITAEGPKVLEFNARFGDPETQVILPRLKSDLLDIFISITDNKLEKANIEWNSDTCVGVVMASGGYPGKYEKNFVIDGLGKVDEGIMVFHAGTKLNDNLKTVTDGGRVITVAATGQTIAKARDKVYNNLSKIHFDGCNYRNDIAAREVN